MPGSSTLAGLLREQSRIRGDHPLLVRDSERIGYAEADRLSARLARGLIALGARKGTHVGLLYPNGVPFVVGMLAAARIGAVVVPFSTFATGPEMHQQLVDSDVEIVLAAASYRSHDYTQRFEETPPALEAEKPKMTNGFAASIAHLARHPSFEARDLSSMRRGNLYPIMAPDARPADPELRHNMLGMTEAGSVVLLSGDETDQPQHRRGSFGKPAPGFQTKVVDLDSGNPVGVGDVGELCLREPYVMQRYYKRSREECFDADGWFHTGDLVRTDSDGFYYFVGRRGSMIKTAGANVSPAEVEKAIAKVTGGRVAYVVGIPHPERGQQVAAVVVVGDGEQFDESALRHKLKSQLSAFKIPTRFVAVSEVPLLSSGKVDMQKLMTVFDA